jgi:hypothetical protein
MMGRVRRLAAMVLLTAMMSVGAKSMNPQDDGPALQRLGIGQQLGACLVRGCVVVVGTVQALGKAEAAPGQSDPQRATWLRTVDLKVQQWLRGQPAGDSLRVVQAAAPAISKSGLGPWNAWEHARVELGAPLLLVRWTGDAPRPTWFGQPEDVALALTDPGLVPPVQQAIAQHRRFETDPAAVASIPRLLREQGDALFTGYALTVLMDGEVLRHIDTAGALLAGLIGHASLPAQARALVGDWLAANFYRLSSDAARRTVAEALVVAAHGDDQAAVLPALAALSKLAAQPSLNLRPLLTPVRQRRLIDHYRALRADNRLPAAPELEALLGLR